jgi:hypothetical protein
MNKEYIEVGNYFIEGFMRGAFEIEDMKDQIETKLINCLPKFVNNEENTDFEKAMQDICLIVNRTIRVLSIKALEDKNERDDFSMEKYLDWSKIEL